MSSAEYFDITASPEATSIQNRLLDIVSSCLSAFLSLSPDLLSLVTDDVVDSAAFEQLLHVAFSTPSFEQVKIHFLHKIFFFQEAKIHHAHLSKCLI
jgi:hypothetical protein